MFFFVSNAQWQLISHFSLIRCRVRMMVLAVDFGHAQSFAVRSHVFQAVSEY